MSAPPIILLYQWLRKGAPCPTLSANDLSIDAIEEAWTKLSLNKKTYENSIAQMQIKHQTPEASAMATVWFDNAEDYAGLSDFINFLQQHKETLNPWQSILNYLLANPETATNSLEAFHTLFTAWLAITPDKALDWYDEDMQQRLSSTQPEIAHVIAKRVTDHYLKETRVLFQSVVNLTNLIPLLAAHYDNPQRMAAFIVALLERELTVDEIMKSGLLHQYLLANIDCMDREDKPVNRLYQLLDAFPVAEHLSAEAKVTSIRTAEGTNEVFQNYSLDGEVHFSDQKARALKSICLSPFVFNWQLQPVAFKPFYDLFGQWFIVNMLQCYSTSGNADIKQLLAQQFNRLSSDGAPSQELMQLLNDLARDSSALLSTIAELLSEATVKAFIESGNFVVFHLISFKPNWLEKINLIQVQRYINSLQISNIEFDQLILLRTMLLQFKSQWYAHEVTTLIFNVIINVLLSNPNLVDPTLIGTLRSVAGITHQKALLQQASNLALQLSQLIKSMVTRDSKLTQDTTQDLNDAWRDLSRKLAVLKEIAPDLASDFPGDKYALYVNLVKELLACQGSQFDLQATLSCLFPKREEQEQLCLESFVGEYERTLIELLAAIDNEALWDRIIHQLESSPINRVNWVDKQYGGNTPLELASKQGNNALVQYLLKKNKLTPVATSQLLKKAIAKQQWDMVAHLIHLPQENKPNLESIGDALVAATKVGELRRLLVPKAMHPLQGFFQVKRPHNDLIELPVEPASILALLTAHGEEETVKQVLQLSPELLKSLLTPTNITDYSGRTFIGMTAFKYALWAGDWNMWIMMLDSLKEAYDTRALTIEEAKVIQQDLRNQYNEIVQQGVTYTLNDKIIRDEHHFNLQPLIEALKIYDEQYDKWSYDQRKIHWCRTIGWLQRFVPVNVAQHFCEAISFDKDKNFHEPLQRSLQLYNWDLKIYQAWFPLSSSNQLGVDFGIYNNSIMVSAGNRGQAFNCSGGGLSQEHVQRCDGALSALSKERANDINVLGEKLLMPIEHWALGLGSIHGMT